MYDKSCIDIHQLERQCPLDNARVLEPLPSAHTGRLACLPLEIQQMILSQLDLQSLTTIRAVSRSMRLSVTTLPQYGTLMTRAPQLVRALLSTSLGPWITIPQLYRAVINQASCAGCGDYGPFVYLPTASRVCVPCIRSDSRFLPLTLNAARKRYHVPVKTILSAVPLMRTLPGEYSERPFHRRRREKIIDKGMMENLYASLYGATNPLPQDDSLPRDGKGGNAMRFIGLVKVPYSNATTEDDEGGLRCMGCLRSFAANRRVDPPRKLDWRRLFTKDGLIAHIQECPRSKAALEKHRMETPSKAP